MRILIVYSSSFGVCPFVPSLKKALESCGAMVDWGMELFWKSSEQYDVILFQWPESIWNFTPVDDVRVASLKERITYWKSTGAKIAYTRHNIMSHADKSLAMQALYRLVENSSDLIVHMGKNSLTEYIAGHRDNLTQKQVVIPQHTTEWIDREISVLEARQRLRLPADGKIILGFGAFRFDEERRFVLEAFRKLKVKGKVLVTPSLFPGRVFRRNPFWLAVKIARRLPFLIKYGVFGTIFKSSTVPNTELPYYFAASDAVLIQRLKILNSGNLPMGFYFGKVVIGPNVGNVGEILEQTGNPTFDPNNLVSLTQAMAKALSDDCATLGERNRKYADINWASVEIGKKYCYAFQDLLNLRGER